jgi:hypothetical protein
VVPSEAAMDDAKGCGWHGMQEVRGSNPLSSTPINPQVKRPLLRSQCARPCCPLALGGWLEDTTLKATPRRASMTATTRACISEVVCR